MPEMIVGNHSIYFDYIQGKPPALVFVHGAGGSHKRWNAQKEYFKSRGRAVLAISLPGHVGSDPDPENKPDIAHYAEEVVTITEGIGQVPAVFIGHSMGGAIVQTIALKYPQHVEAIILTATGCKLKVIPLIFEMISDQWDKMLEMFGQFAMYKPTPELIEELQEDLKVIPPELVYDDFKTCDSFDIKDKIADIDAPTLIICGSKDQLTPPKYSKFLNEKISDSRLAIIKKAGHCVMMEKPEEYNGIVENFLIELGF